MKQRILLAILRIASAFGLFRLARSVTGRELRILCYHGSAVLDENHFRPSLFMTSATFAARMEFLAANDYPVLGLSDALERLRARTLPAGATVITIDDGWIGTYRNMVPVLSRLGFPATLYVASYYLEKQTQVFNVALDYVMWKAGDRELDISLVADGLTGTYRLPATTERAEALRVLLHHAESLAGAAERQSLLRRICKVLGVATAELEEGRVIAFMSEDEARDALEAGVDIQLHTHRHRFPRDSFAAARQEIQDNRRALGGVTRHELCHFCYPSGEYVNAQIPWLERLGIHSATTTKPGFNRADSSPYELKRFLDSEDITALEFEAELSGFFELIRRCGYRI